MTRFRITVRGQGVELRGFIDGELEDVNAFAESARPWVVVASFAADDYDPFKEADLRELHHFETEEILDRIRTARSNHPEIPECDKHPEGDPITCGWKAAIIDIDRALS